MEQKVDNIYIYIWEEFNTIYVGRTVNPKSRHWAHRHRETEPTYKFSSEHHVEHPKMIIIENDLSIEEGIKREQYWINYYREESSYNVLNKSRGGQAGKKNLYTKDDLINHRKEYYQKNKNFLNDYQKKYYSVNKDKIREYQKAYREKNKEKMEKYIKEYRNLHKEEILIKHREYNKEHREEINEKRKTYYKNKKL